MRRHMLVVVAAMALWGRPAMAGDNDIVLSRLGMEAGGGAAGNGQDFRSLASQLGVVLAPRLLSPADTLGFGGFQFSADLGFTGIDSNAAYWRARESSPAPTGGGSHGGSIMPTLSVFARKGMWFPVPSFEMGAGMVHLMGSRMVAAQGYGMLALHEGYHGLPLPSLAVRGAVSRMMGQPDLDLTVVSVDASIAKEFGIAGTVNLAPYAGWNTLIIVPRSEVIDRTPNVADDPAMNFVFAQQDDILRHRIFGGARVKYDVLAVLLEVAFALGGSSVDGITGAADQARSQATVTLGLGVDF